MPDRPQRPPRPDEADLVRFHNGDTLDNIPVVRPPEIPLVRPPEPAPPPRRFWLTAAAVAVPVALIGALIGAVVAETAGDRGPRTDAGPPAESSAPVETAPSSPTPRASIATPPAGPSPGESLTVAAGPQLEQIRVIQAPATGGDPSTAYCLVYTGSDSSGVKDAILLANAPAYQCTDLLPYDEYEGSFATEVPYCEPPARSAVLSFAESSEWAGAVYFTCLTQHTGA
jgi:hypothetical protein